MNGYECQIQNGMKDGDRNKPQDCGTGGFYRRSDARRIVANDLEWFHLTLIASGPHMASWVNGIQVSDWTDTPAKPHENPRSGLRVEKGTLMIRGHDPTTDLSFRNLRTAEMAGRGSKGSALALHALCRFSQCRAAQSFRREMFDMQLLARILRVAQANMLFWMPPLHPCNVCSLRRLFLSSISHGTFFAQGQTHDIAADSSRQRSTSLLHRS